MKPCFKAVLPYFWFCMAAVWLAGCSQSLPPLPPRSVLVFTVSGENQGGELRYSAVIRSRTETPLSFRIGGKLLERRVDRGGVIEKGQLLARLDPADQALNLAAAEADLALAKADLARYRALRAQNFVSQTALDAKENALKALLARAGLAQRQRDYADLHSDEAGVIASVEAEAGQVVAAGQTIFRLARPDQPEAAFDLPESRLESGHVKIGDTARIILWAHDAQDEKVYTGKIREIGAVADPASRTYPVRASIEGADGALKLGMSAAVAIPTKKEGVRLPGGAVFRQGEKDVVWRVGADNRVSLLPVTVLAWEEGYARVSGIAAGIRVVAAGVHKLAADEEIHPVEWAK